MPKSTTHFVVFRRNWRVTGRASVFVLAPGETRLGTFVTAAEAESDARAREDDARQKVNPFWCGVTWSDRSHLPEPVFCDFLHDAGIEPPAKEGRDWVKWWELTGRMLTEVQRARVWEGLDRVRFFDVAERTKRQVVYAVVEVQWKHDDRWYHQLYYPGVEGGAVQSAFWSRERAEQECARRNAEARAKWRADLPLPESGSAEVEHLDGYGLYPFDMESRLFPGQDPFGHPVKPPPRYRADGTQDYLGGVNFAVEEVLFFELIEFEVEEDG